MRIFNRILLTTITLTLLFSCIDEHVIEINKNVNGSIYLTSQPSGAEITLLGTDTKKNTPDSIINLESGLYEVTFRLENYRDTSFGVQVFKNQRTTKNIELKSKTSDGKIIIDSTPTNAEIFLNNTSTHKFTPDSLTNLANGIYTIKLVFENTADTTFTVEISGNNKTINIQVTSSVHKGELFFDSLPQGAKIFLNETNTGKFTPDTLKELPVGSYLIKLTLKDFKDTSTIAEVTENDISKYKITLKDTTSEVTVKINYFVNSLTGQLKFQFSFNQDIALDYIDLREPHSSKIKSFAYNSHHYTEGIAAELVYQEKKNGLWRFSIIGKKLGGRKTEFKINTKLTVE